MSSIVKFGKTITIDTAKPLPQYDNGPAKAYAAVDSARARGKNLIAFICDPAYVARRMTIANYKGMMTQGAFIFVNSGVCDWPLTGEQRFVIFYEYGFFEPVLARNKYLIPVQWRDSEVNELFVKQLIRVLASFSDRGIYHGSIRLSNIFFSEQGKISEVVLGDGLSVPPSSTQDILFETIERSMAHPLGRGEGTSADDVYSFGVCLAILLRTIDPMEGLREEEIIEYKLQHGSYMALAGKDRISGHLLEILRGCLHDNPDQRWKVSDLVSWAEGRRLTPQQIYRTKKAIRPFEFDDEKYFFTRDLAYGLSKNLVLAQTKIESGELLEWVERSVNDTEILETIKNYLGRDMAKSKVKGNNAAMVSAVISMLEPSFPIFYKDKILFPNGAGNYLVNMIKNEDDYSDIIEMILSNVFMNYLFLKTKAQNQPFLIKVFESCRLALGQSNMGFGLERCVYILSKDAQCLSSKFNKFFVMDVEGMMDSFEVLCSKGQIKSSIFLDRHCVAFLSILESSIIDGRLYDLNSKTKHQNVLANLRALAGMEKRIKGGTFPNIAKVLAENMNDILSRFHDKDLRKSVEGELMKVSSGGGITEILQVIDNKATKNKDKEDFKRAMREFAALREEYRILDAGMKNPALFGQQSGNNISALLSWVLAIIIIVMMLIFHMVR